MRCLGGLLSFFSSRSHFCWHARSSAPVLRTARAPWAKGRRTPLASVRRAAWDRMPAPALCCRAVPTPPASVRGQGGACLAAFGRALPPIAGPPCHFCVASCRLLPDPSANTPRTYCRSMPGLAGLSTALPCRPANEQFATDASLWISFVPLPGGTFRLSPAGEPAHSPHLFAVSHFRESPNGATMKRDRCPKRGCHFAMPLGLRLRTRLP
jgi:hypothetical protein